MDKGRSPQRRVILRKGPPNKPTPEVSRAQGPPKQSPGPKGAQPKKPKRQPPQVIFWPEDNALWTWSTIPPHPRLLQLFHFILEEIKKRGWASVTVLQYFRIDKDNPAYPHGQNPCMALDFIVGGVKDVEARNFAQKMSSRWIHGGPPGRSGKPLQVLRYLENEKGAHFHLEVTDNTHPVNES